MKKLLNLEWSFSNIDNTWKNKTCIIMTQTFRIVINLSKTFLQTQSFFIVYNHKQMIFILGKTGSGKTSWLTSKGLSELLPRIQNLYQITYLFCNTVQSISIQLLHTNWLALSETLRLQCICRAQLLIHTTHLPCSLPCNYVTSLLASSRWYIRINRYTYCIQLL